MLLSVLTCHDHKVVTAEQEKLKMDGTHLLCTSEPVPKHGRNDL